MEVLRLLSVAVHSASSDSLQAEEEEEEEEVYIPKAEVLQGIGLHTMMRDEKDYKWHSLHVTAALEFKAAAESCEYKVRIVDAITPPLCLLP